MYLKEPVRHSTTAILSTNLHRVAWSTLNCAHRTSTVSSCAFCEQEGHLAAPSLSLQARSLPLKGSAAWLILYCARRTTFIYLNDPSKLARTPFTRGGPIGLPLRASNEGLLRPRVARAQETNGLPLLPPIAARPPSETSEV